LLEGLIEDLIQVSSCLYTNILPNITTNFRFGSPG
jgi:hypothetical protein